MAHMNPSNSRAIAVATLGFGLPDALNFQKQALSRCCAFHAIALACSPASLFRLARSPSRLGFVPVGPGRLDEHPSEVGIAGLGDRSSSSLTWTTG
jgi:hypothetical protein